MSELHFVVPDTIDDPALPSGGNVYDRRLSDAVIGLGWKVQEHQMPGSWPCPDRRSQARLSTVLADLPDRSTVLIDGLIGSAATEVLLPEAVRLHLVPLVHMLFGDGEVRDELTEAERALMRAARAAITTSEWTKQELIGRYGVSSARVCVARPGVDMASPATVSHRGERLLCVAALAAHKGQDVLVEALGTLAEIDWTARLVGSTDRDPAFTRRIRSRLDDLGLTGRIALTGPLTGHDLDHAYRSSDLLVVPSHSETFGMVVVEALARAVPVIATEVGGLPEALGRGGDVPGLLVPPADPGSLAAALKSWLSDATLRQNLRMAAWHRRPGLDDWGMTARAVVRALSEMAA